MTKERTCQVSGYTRRIAAKPSLLGTDVNLSLASAYGEAASAHRVERALRPCLAAFPAETWVALRSGHGGR